MKQRCTRTYVRVSLALCVCVCVCVCVSYVYVCVCVCVCTQAVAAGPRDLAPLIRALRNVEVLQCLSGSQLLTLVAAMTEV